MPDERLITEIESILSQVVELGAEKERTRLGPNLLVTNSAPAGLSNYVLVKDDRDGDNILALKVPGVIYNTNDLVNVLFIKGGEAIAFQQGSASSSSGIWGIVSGTSTDIFYNAGDVGIGKTVAPDARLELLDTAQAQLRLTYQEDTKYATFTVDTNHDLTIDPSSTGQIILAAVDVTIEEDLIHSGDTDTKITFAADQQTYTVGGLVMLRMTNTTQDIVEIGDVAGGGDVDVNINSGKLFVQGSDGYVGIGITTPEQPLSIVTGAAKGIVISDVTTNNTTKDTRFLLRHYNNAAEEEFAFFGASCSNTSAQVRYGGGFGVQNSATLLTFYTAANTTTLSGTERMRINSVGRIGINRSAPTGMIHAYDTISGWLLWEYDGLDGTDREIIANGAGDCLYRLHAEYVLRDSAGAVASGTTDVSNSASVNLTVGGNTVRLRVNADGSVDTGRTAGSDTIKVAYTLRWL